MGSAQNVAHTDDRYIPRARAAIALPDGYRARLSPEGYCDRRTLVAS
jgi:hypothetical protein